MLAAQQRPPAGFEAGKQLEFATRFLKITPIANHENLRHSSFHAFRRQRLRPGHRHHRQGHYSDCPDWVHHAVVYQVYPQTFYDSNGDGIGDLPGIIAKLDYIKSLGVDAIWINPFFDSPFNDAGYDIRDYYKIAPRYGTNEDARRLFAEAHKRGLKVLFDYVTSYTSIDNPWFVASCRQTPSRIPIGISGPTTSGNRNAATSGSTATGSGTAIF